MITGVDEATRQVMIEWTNNVMLPAVEGSIIILTAVVILAKIWQVYRLKRHQN